jgi:hypothetical protein
MTIGSAEVEMAVSGIRHLQCLCRKRIPAKRLHASTTTLDNQRALKVPVFETVAER